MKKNCIVFLSALAVLAGSGCAGEGQYNGPTRYAGSFTGTWANSATKDNGDMSLTILATTEVSGSFTDAGTSLTGNVTGRISERGILNLTIVLSDKTVLPMTCPISIGKINSGTNAGVDEIVGDGTYGSGTSNAPIHIGLVRGG